MNLRDRDSLRAKDKRPVPKVSFVWRLDCIADDDGTLHDMLYSARLCMHGYFVNFRKLVEVLQLPEVPVTKSTLSAPDLDY